MNSTQTALRKTLRTTAGIAAVLAAICTGTGAATAAPTAAAAPHAADETQNSTYQWSLTNRTGTPIFGRWSVSETRTFNRSYVESAKDWPWFPDATQSAEQDYTGKDLTWEAHICYRGHWWGPSRSTPTTMDTKSPTSFNLMVTPDYRLVVSYSGKYYEMATNATDAPC
ncbi:hypothetical protein [Rhodococcus jostii]|uniref:hypothetical protein n=1 Tax=Rhodococcus jostii TaxID=132919 RepID=UPI003636A97B